MEPVRRLAAATATPRGPWSKEEMKRCIDLVLGLLGLLLLSPLFVVIAAWTCLRDGPPVMFRQRRVGLAGAPFLIWKFRTMVAGKPGLPVPDGCQRPALAIRELANRLLEHSLLFAQLEVHLILLGR